MSTKHGIANAGTAAEEEERRLAAELAAWRIGADLARQGRPVISFLAQPAARITAAISEDAWSLALLGHDSWARNVREGYSLASLLTTAPRTADRGIEL